MRAEVVVAGGGPAGLAAAIAAAQNGFSVEVAEPCVGAIDKCCGEGLMPPALHALAQLGIPASVIEAAGAPLTGIRFLAGRQMAQAAFSSSSSAGYGVRRVVLHGLLQARARELGVRITPASAKWFWQDGKPRVEIGGKRREAAWLVGADGAQSAARGVLGLDAGRVASRRFAVRQHFEFVAGKSAGAWVEVYWTRGAQAYLTPVREGCVGVAILAPEKLGTMDKALKMFPALRKKLDGSMICSASRGAVSSHRTLRRVSRGHAALVGDASGSVDAITGEGLSLAFAQAVALGEAMRRGDLRIYEQEHESLMRPARLMSHALLTMGAAKPMTTGGIALLRWVPGLFAGLLGLHTRVSPQSSEAVRESSLPTGNFDGWKNELYGNAAQRKELHDCGL